MVGQGVPEMARVNRRIGGLESGHKASEQCSFVNRRIGGLEIRSYKIVLSSQSKIMNELIPIAHWI